MLGHNMPENLLPDLGLWADWVAARLQEHDERAKQLIEAAIDPTRLKPIEDANQARNVVTFISQINDTLKKVEAERKSIKKGVDDLAKIIKVAAEAIADPLATQKERATKILNAYTAQKEREAAAEAARLKEEAMKAQTADEAKQAFSMASDLEKMGGAIRSDYGQLASKRTNWDFEILDETAIPRRFLRVDEAAIRREINAMKGELQIEGVRIFKNETTVVR